MLKNKEIYRELLIGKYRNSNETYGSSEVEKRLSSQFPEFIDCHKLDDSDRVGKMTLYTETD